MGGHGDKLANSRSEDWNAANLGNYALRGCTKHSEDGAPQALFSFHLLRSKIYLSIFESLSQNLEKALKTLKGQGHITETLMVRVFCTRAIKKKRTEVTPQWRVFCTRANKKKRNEVTQVKKLEP